jgi:hypothetical protein
VNKNAERFRTNGSVCTKGSSPQRVWASFLWKLDLLVTSLDPELRIVIKLTTVEAFQLRLLLLAQRRLDPSLSPDRDVPS